MHGFQFGRHPDPLIVLFLTTGGEVIIVRKIEAFAQNLLDHIYVPFLLMSAGVRWLGLRDVLH